MSLYLWKHVVMWVFVPYYTIPGYNAYYCYCISREGGGTSIYIKNNMKCELLDLEVDNDNIECLGVK